jgi:hypothetical protein
MEPNVNKKPYKTPVLIFSELILSTFLIFETLDGGENVSTVSGTKQLHVMGPTEYRPL